MEIESFFQSLNVKNIGTLASQFYREDVVFKDPLVAIQGRQDLINYYKKMYEGAEEVKFAFAEHLCENDIHMLTWKMTLTSEKLNNGKPFTVDGVSHIKFVDGMASYHRDYFDLSAMFYEKMPIIGGLVGWIKKQATM